MPPKRKLKRKSKRKSKRKPKKKIKLTKQNRENIILYLMYSMLSNHFNTNKSKQLFNKRKNKHLTLIK